MAETPRAELVFDGACPDCGHRQVSLPGNAPLLGDDFDWRARDYDRIRISMLEELAARFPERTRWTEADIEVVLVEGLASALDQLSDMADRVAVEAYLDTARRPESVRRLLGFIGYDAVRESDQALVDDPPDQPGAKTAAQKLELLWTSDPVLMERARRAGPRSVHDQRRMVTERDYTERLEEHPIVRRAAAHARFTGSWTTMQVAVVLRWRDSALDVPHDYEPEIRAKVADFHRKRGLTIPDWDTTPRPTHRMVLEPYLNAYRMAGQPVVLEDAVPVGIVMNLTVEVEKSYFQSEVRQAVTAALGTEPGGFFEPGRLSFGEDLHASDIFQALLRLEGVANVCLTRFKRVGSQYPELAATGLIRLDGLEIAVCDNNRRDLRRGFFTLTFSGGRKG